MVADGLLEEARNLYPYRNLNALQTVGYSELFEYFDGKISLEKAIELIKIHTRQYAKRQVTWFNKAGVNAYFSPGKTDSIIEFVEHKLQDTKE
jgi:tRNA dimethylallyltransferase